MTGIFKSLIPENCCPVGATEIEFVQDGVNKYSLKCPARMLTPSSGRLYSFGALSDIHTFATTSYTSDTTANTDFENALSFFSGLYNDGEVDFVAICGDLTCYGNQTRQATAPISDLERYKSIVTAQGVTVPIYAMAGNHEWWNGTTVTDALMQTYTGHDICYTFTKGDDVFVMCGMASSSYVFTAETIAWLSNVLETNRNKRCFVFCHGPILGYSGDPTRIYPFDILGNEHGATFIQLLQHYTNCIYFHGHTHILFSSQSFTQNHDPQIPNCIYDQHLGIHSIHIPSLAIPIDITTGERVVVPSKSQGYLVDVYANKIVLRGRDFVNNKWVAVSQYQLDTVLNTIPSIS